MTYEQADVFICGGGPVGLLLAYQLARMGVSTYIVEQVDKTKPGSYGGAGSMYPRTLELLDQLDLGDAVLQQGFVSRHGIAYRDGVQVTSRGYSFLSSVTDTFRNYALNLRQRYTELTILRAFGETGGTVHFEHVLEEYRLLEDTSDDHKIEITVINASGQQKVVRAKYIVGADGGKSTVRRLAGIAMEGQQTPDRWVRIDAVVKTDMPHARLGTAIIESSTHGNILFASLDHGRSRIGYALSQRLYDKYNGDLTRDNVMYEAQQAMTPFSLDFETVDWHTVYSIGQRVAQSFYVRERILLAGDAGHTHSSGAAQGMNTGIQDAVNLAWKLGGVLKGIYKKSVLDTYNTERRPIAQRLIKLDNTVSALASGHVPDELKTADGSQDANILLANHFNANAAFNTGLGVYYEADNVLNKDTPVISVKAGHRGPDVLVRRPGSSLPSRLYDITKNVGKFWVIIFAGRPAETRVSLQALAGYLNSNESFTQRLADAFSLCTIAIGPGNVGQPDEFLGVEGLGYKCFDPEETAHVRYGVPSYSGAIVCLRPDGMVGFATNLDKGSEVGQYFDDIVPTK